jgi:hyperosmotically inducible protein
MKSGSRDLPANSGKRRLGQLPACRGEPETDNTINFLTKDTNMKKTMTRVGLLSCMLLSVAIAQPQSDTSPMADNTKVNQRDKNPNEATADGQKMNAADQALTAKIRRTVIADKTLSTYAHNIKIVSQDGVVTLKGPVHSEAEVNNLIAKAADAAGSPDRVVNQLSIK